MSSSSSSAPNTRRSTDDMLCFCGDMMQVRTSWTNSNPGRRFISCPNYGSDRRCRKFKFLDVELPNEYYKDLMFQQHMQVRKLERDNQLEHCEAVCSENMRLMDELKVSKAKVQAYDRLLMVLIVVVVCLCSVIVVLAL
ncbi:hypothetical protein OSB04_011472 [Centaurea solstitialis]|uniref:Zinc finger GRF-type domain-containing protein n=1 Tax=Centaurea solstitialis TaxID=347529 RepID=A0AA38T9H1_9ASTR|nr:hypothetical protein OSB04_011472 [Centaurea solstitialis]